MRNIPHLILTLSLLLGVSKNGLADSFPGIVYLKSNSTQTYTDPAGDLSKYRSDTIEFIFYSEPNTTHSTRQISFYFDWSRIPRKTRIVEQNYHEWLSPISFNDDTTSGYFKLYLTCSVKNEDWLQVVLNEKTGETGWLHKNQSVQFISWNHLDNRKFWVTVQNNTPDYFSQPDTTSQKLQYNGINCFELIRIKGDWMLVSNKNSEMCDNYNQPYLHKAWIRFKTSSKLLVQLEIR